MLCWQFDTGTHRLGGSIYMIAHFNRNVKSFLNQFLSSSVFTSQEVLKMTGPFILDSLSIMFINMLITALISSSGESSVAAVSLVGPLLTLVVCFLNGVAAGGTVAVTQSYGSGDIQKTKEAAGHILWLTVLIGTGLSLLLILFPHTILSVLYPKAEQIVLEKATDYMVGGGISLIIFTLYTGVFCILRGLGESKKCLYLTIIINVSYLLFSILFLNILKMDIRGSSLALILARSIGSLSALAFLFLPKNLPIRLDLSSIFSYRKSILNTIMQVSVPFGMEQLFLYGGNIVMNTFTVPLGTTALAINSIASSLFSIATSAANAAGNLSVTVVGRCIGAKAKPDAFRYGWKMLIMAFLLIVLGCGIFYPFFPLLLKDFYHASPEATVESLRLLRNMLIPTFLFWSVSNVVPYILRSANDTVFPSALSMVSMWMVRVGGGYLLAIHLGMGLDGLWIAMWAEWAFRALFLVPRFFRKKWLHKADQKMAIT